jgi:hypothetical protein
MSSREFSEEELRQIEAEMEKVSVDDVLLQTLVTLLNLAARKAGLARRPGEEGPPPDLEQMRQAIEGARALMPLVEARHREQLGPVRDTLSQLQLAYSQLSQRQAAPGAEPPAADEPPAGEPPERSGGEASGRDSEPGPAQQSGRLWVPGQ